MPTDSPSPRPVKVIVWGENVHDQKDVQVQRVYPLTMHGTIAAAIRRLLGDKAEVATANLQEPAHGLTQARLDATDVLLWWGHVAHDDVADEVVDRVQRRVEQGMGLVVLHSGHHSKIFRRLMGTGCDLCWREADDDGVADEEILWQVAPDHPILRGVRNPVVLPAHEMYGEPFTVPPSDELLLISNFSGGEVFRSGMCWTRGYGKIFYFSPGHETHPIYHDPDVQRILANAVEWCVPGPGVGTVRKRSPHAPKGWFRTSVGRT